MRAKPIIAACLVMLTSVSAWERKPATPMTPSAARTPAVATGTPAAVTTSNRGSATQPDRQVPIGMVEQLFAAWKSHDANKVVAFYTDDVAYEDVPLGRTSHGRDEFRKFVEDTFSAFPDLNVEVVSSSACHGHGVSEVVWNATDKGFLKTDKRFSIRMVSVFELRQGKISRNKDFYDLSTILRQLGASPPDKTASTHSDSAQDTAAFAQAAESSKPLTNEEKELLEIDHTWAEAEQKQEIATLDRILDSRFLYVGSSGKVYSRSDFVDEIRGMKILSYSVTDEIARSYGQTGVVTGEWRGRWSADGKEGEDRLHFTAVYTKREGKWYAVAEQMTLPAQ
jgi:steroid delta-isomerase-like uncharacterized protein